MVTRILAVLNQKGGVGKTTTCVNLGAALARRGRRVLLIDLDPQANLTVHLGLEPHRTQRSTYSLLLGEHALADAVQPADEGRLGVVASTLALANAEIQLASAVGRELILREALEEYLQSDGGRGTEFVLVDCPPSLGILTMNALCAAGEVLLPIQTEFFALQGVAGILESLKAVQRLNRALRLSLVVPCMVDRRTTLSRDVIDEVRNYFGPLASRTVIRSNVKLAEAPSHGQTIFAYDPSCNGAQDYAALALEVLGELPPESPPEAAAAPAGSGATSAAGSEPGAGGEVPEPGEPAEPSGETGAAQDSPEARAAAAEPAPEVEAVSAEAPDDPFGESPPDREASPAPRSDPAPAPEDHEEFGIAIAPAAAPAPAPAEEELPVLQPVTASTAAEDDRFAGLGEPAPEPEDPWGPTGEVAHATGAADSLSDEDVWGSDDEAEAPARPPGIGYPEPAAEAADPAEFPSEPEEPPFQRPFGRPPHGQSAGPGPEANVDRAPLGAPPNGSRPASELGRREAERPVPTPDPWSIGG